MDELIVIDTQGKEKSFSVDVFVKNQVTNGMELVEARELGMSLYENLRELSVSKVTTDQIRHWVAERDPRTLVQDRILNIEIDLNDLENPLDTIGINEKKVLEPFIGKIDTTRSANVKFSNKKIVASVPSFGEYHMVDLLKSALFPTLFDDYSSNLILEGLYILDADMFANFEGQTAPGPIGNIGQGNDNPTPEQLERDIANKQKLLEAATSEMNRLALLTGGSVGITPIMEQLRRKLGNAAMDKLEKMAAEEMGFASAQAAKNAGKKTFLKRILMIAKRLGWLAILVEVAPALYFLTQALLAQSKVSSIHAEIHAEMETLNDPELIIDAGPREGVGGKIGPRPGCVVKLVYLVSFINDKGDYNEEELHSEILQPASDGTREHIQDITVPKRGTRQFFEVRFEVKCPNQDVKIYTVIKQAVR